MFSPHTDKFIESPNYTWGRQGQEVRYIVLHTTEGTGLGTLNWFRNRSSQVSAHYVVMEDGEIICMVPEEHSAWHAGAIVGTPTTPLYTGVNPNFESIGIELAGYHNVPVGPQQAASAGALVSELMARYGVPVVTHAQLSPGNRRDPGAENLRLVMEAAEMPDFSEQIKQEIRNMLMAPEGSNLVEFAVSRPGGYGDKLKDALKAQLASAVDRAFEEAHNIALRELRRS